MKKIIVLDDDKRQGRRYVQSLNGLSPLKKFCTFSEQDIPDFKSMCKILKERASAANSTGLNDENWTEIFDLADIFIIDYRLTDVPGFPIYGEDIAYYLRYFSKCKYIIGLNRFGEKTYDLTLNGHIDSFADINIGCHDLNNLGLWIQNDSEYRPWHWPILLSYIDTFDKRVADVHKHLDDCIYKVLGFSTDTFLSIAQSAGEMLNVPVDQLLKVTFNKLFTQSPLIIKGKFNELKLTDTIKSRIITARISKWIERLILPGQDVIVDAPHLITRCPSLLSNTKLSQHQLNKTTNMLDYRDLGLNYRSIEKYRFKKDYWLSRPSWFWHELSEDMNILENKEPWKTKTSRYVFAEDTSRFYPKESCKPFVSNVNSVYNVRYIRKFRDVEYRPIIKLYSE